MAAFERPRSDAQAAIPLAKEQARKSQRLWGNLLAAVWSARCAFQLRQLEPRLDPDKSLQLAASLLEDARTGLEPDELASVSPEEAARRYATYGWVDYWPQDHEP